MIRLSEQSPLGTGRHRKCYAHPEDAVSVNGAPY